VAAAEPAEREKIMELTTSWKEEGIELGRAEGRAEGALAIVLLLLAKRLGPLPPATAARVHALPAAPLQALAEAVLDFETAQDLEHWLARRPA
jgi:flagellar biosynthesis/type III secretory pathway protein FliH